jgi:hypothetical protein
MGDFQGLAQWEEILVVNLLQFHRFLLRKNETNYPNGARTRPFSGPADGGKPKWAAQGWRQYHFVHKTL